MQCNFSDYCQIFYTRELIQYESSIQNNKNFIYYSEGKE